MIFDINIAYMKLEDEVTKIEKFEGFMLSFIEKYEMASLRFSWLVQNKLETYWAFQLFNFCNSNFQPHFRLDYIASLSSYILKVQVNRKLHSLKPHLHHNFLELSKLNYYIAL